MPSQEQARSAVDETGDYTKAGERLGVPPGQAYLLATGLPADGSDTGLDLASEGERGDEPARPYSLAGATQQLVNQPPVNPTRKEHILDWVKRRAAADTQMRAAADRRSVEPPPPRDRPDDPEVTDELTVQHNQAHYLVKQLEAVPGHSKSGSREQVRLRATIVDALIPRLRRHDEAEQLALWPVVERLLPDGAQLKERAAGLGIPAILDRLEALGPDTDEFDEAADALINSSRKHVALCDAVFLRLREALSQDESRALGQQARRFT